MTAHTPRLGHGPPAGLLDVGRGEAGCLALVAAIVGLLAFGIYVNIHSHNVERRDAALRLGNVAISLDMTLSELEGRLGPPQAMDTIREISGATAITTVNGRAVTWYRSLIVADFVENAAKENEVSPANHPISITVERPFAGTIDGARLAGSCDHVAQAFAATTTRAISCDPVGESEAQTITIRDPRWQAGPAR